MATRSGSAEWQGDLVTGLGRLTVGADRWTSEYSFGSRFHGVLDGAVVDDAATNPEELLAAAHAASFSMALSLGLTEQGHAPVTIQTRGQVHLRRIDGIPAIARIDLQTEAEVPGLDEAEFHKSAEAAKDSCIVCRALAGGVPEITLSARLR